MSRCASRTTTYLVTKASWAGERLQRPVYSFISDSTKRESAMWISDANGWNPVGLASDASDQNGACCASDAVGGSGIFDKVFAVEASTFQG